MRADEDGDDGEAVPQAASEMGTCRIVLISGFESFNVDLYRQVAGCVCLLTCDLSLAHGIGVPPQTWSNNAIIPDGTAGSSTAVVESRHMAPAQHVSFR